MTIVVQIFAAPTNKFLHALCYRTFKPSLTLIAPKKVNAYIVYACPCIRIGNGVRNISIILQRGWTPPWMQGAIISPARENGFQCQFPVIVFPNRANVLENLLSL